MTAEVLNMLKKDNEDLGIQALREWTKDQVEKKGVTVSTLAAEIGFSRPLLSTFINHGKSSSNLVERLMALRERVEGVAQPDNSDSPPRQRNFKREIGLLHTEDFQQAVGICSMCHRDGEIGVIIGHAGSGKTTALEEFCADRIDVKYIRAKITMNVKTLLVAIGESLDLGEISGSKEKLLRTIINELRQNPVTLIIDEADLLVDKYSVAKLETLRAIWDETRTGMIICGMPKLAKYLVKGPGGDENLAQIYSRIRRAHRMRGVSRDELTQILEGFNISEAAKKYLMARGASVTQGGLRRFTRLLKNALDMVEDGEAISLEIIKEADGLLVTPETLGLGL